MEGSTLAARCCQRVEHTAPLDYPWLSIGMLVENFKVFYAFSVFGVLPEPAFSLCLLLTCD